VLSGLKVDTNRLRTAILLQRPVLAVAICLVISQTAFADQDDSVTTISGTGGGDILDIDTTEDAAAGVSSIVGETSTAVGTVVDSLGGDDTVTVDAEITALADILTGILSDPAKSENTASSTGISTGDGADTVNSSGVNTSTATSNVAYQAVVSVDILSAEIGSDEVDVSINSEANSTGVDTGDGDDVVVSSSTITSTATSHTGGVAAPVNADFSESVTTKAASNSSSTAIGINSGAGGDQVTSGEQITTSATADSGVVAVNVTSSDGADADKKVQNNLEASATSEATSTGIETDGDDTSSDSDTTTRLVDGALEITREQMETATSGDDTVTNTRGITSTSVATSDSTSISASISASGSVKATLNAAATAGSRGISTGGGNDYVDNSGAIVTDSMARASAAGTSIATGQGGDEASKQKTESSTNVTSTATSIGIDAEGPAQSTEFTGVTSMGATGISNTRTTRSIASTGADEVHNTGTIGATSNATVGTVVRTVQIEAEGAAASAADSTATSYSAGVNTGGGNDIVDNAGASTADAISTGGAIGITFSQGGTDAESKVDAKVTSDSTAVGIAADGNSSDVETTLSTSISDGALTISRSHQETAQHGDDDVTNTATIAATAYSISGAAGGSATIDGAASTDISSTSKSKASAIDAGGGDDIIDNNVTDPEGLISSATSKAGALGVGFGQMTEEKGKPKVEVKASAIAESEAIGIAGDSGQDVLNTFDLDLSGSGLDVSLNRTVTAQSGNDIIDSVGSMTVTADSDSGVLGVAVTIDGAANVEAAATAASKATAISGGGGDDVITSDGSLITVDASSTSAGVTVGVGKGSPEDSKAKTKVAAETTADAAATGIAGDGGVDDSTLAVDLTIDDTGIHGSYARTTTAATGDDSLTNLGEINSTATATTGAASVAVSINGGASADVDSTAKATARGLDSGGGVDTIDNIGTLTTSASATAATVSVSVSTKGTAGSTAGLLDGGTAANSDAVGISSAGSDHSTSTTISADINFDDVGLAASYESIKDSISGDGADIINNSGDLTSTSNATTVALSVGVSGKGTALTLGRSKAESHAGGIESGNGDDIITNDGTLTSNSKSVAVGANVSVTAKGVGVAGNAAWDGGTTGTSTATGIDADSGKITTTRVDAEANADRAQVIYETTEEAASGDDVVINDGEITAHAISDVGTLSVAVAPTGVGVAVSTSTAESEATGIRGGNGDDVIENRGVVTSTTDATALTANVSVALKGGAVAADAVWDSGTSADATSIGIAGDGGDQTSVTRIAVGTDEMSYSKTGTIASGADSIDNFGEVTATANAKAASFSVGVVASAGVAAATATSTANATASAIDAGAGDDIDDVYNTGTLNATANADAASASLSITNTGVSVAADSVWDGGTTATATARGIDVGSGGETIENHGEINSLADSFAGSVAAAATVTGAAGATASATGTADSTAIDASGGDDDDIVINSGELTSIADADAAALSVSVVNTGFAIAAGAAWDGGTTSTAISRGIDVGNGADQVSNSGDITVTADSDAKEAAVSVAVTGVAGAIATSTAMADAIAIDAGDDNAVDVVGNSGALTVMSEATALTSSVAVTTAGGAVAWDGGTSSDAQARGIYTGEGADWIENEGELLDIDANATTTSLAVAVAVSGVAVASASADSSAEAVAIDAGSGDFDDVVINSGELDVDAVGLAAGASVSFTSVGLSAGVGEFKGGTTSDATARGIQMGGGADIVENYSDINSTAGSTAASAAVAVALSGGAAAVATSTSLSDASGIDTGEGADADSVLNTKLVNAEAKSTAATATVAVTLAGGAISAGVFDGGTRAESSARGIETGFGADMIENRGGEVVSTAESTALAASVSVAVTGVSGAISTSTAIADSTAIDAGDDDSDDSILNTGDVTANSDANAVSAAVSVTVAGVSGGSGDPWNGGTTADSNSVAMQLGGGADTVVSDGVATADSDATATGISVALTLEGVAGAISASNGTAAATGIDLGAGDDVIDSAGQITASSDAIATSVSVAAVKFGVSAAGSNSWDGGTRAEATVSGISAGTGADTVFNSAIIDSTATALADAVSVGFTVGGVSAANSAASADARAIAIDGGADNDRIENLGNLTATADTKAVAVSVSVTGIGVSGGINNLWDGGTTTDAMASGINGGDGDDVILSGIVADGEAEPEPSSITANAESTAVSVSASVTVGGVGIAISTSTANAAAAGIDAGAGDDIVVNDSDLTGNAIATSDSVNVAFTGAGGAAAGDASFTGGTTANADAFGIAGGIGNDELRNTNVVTADAHSEAKSVAIAATVIGVAGATATSTSTADATALSGDEGDDLIVNEGTVNSSSLAEADGVSVAVSGIGGAVAGSFLDNGSTAEATATGIGGGDGIDTLANMLGADIDVLATAESRDTSVAVTLTGIAAAGSAAAAVADSFAMAGGDGNDFLMNEGSVSQESVADARARSIAVSGLGGAISSAGALGHAIGTGLAGGAGDDKVHNSGDMTLTSTASSIGQSISFVNGGGAAVGEANANAIAEAAGLRGDGGDDMLTNSGNLSVTTQANTTARAISVNYGVGFSLGAANSVATTDVAGMLGGDGDDVLYNAGTGVIDLLAAAGVEAGSLAVVAVGGVASAEAKTMVDVNATGLAGEAGDDQVQNDGDLAVNGTSRSTATGGSVSVAGSSSSKAGTEVDSVVVGISGGLGADVIVNTGRIWVGPLADITAAEWMPVNGAWMSVLKTDSSSFGFAGAVGAESAAFARTTSTGISGGDGDDQILNDGAVTVIATALSDASASSLGIFGSADATGGSGAFTRATGLAGGAGNDLIDSFGSLDVFAKSRLTQESTTFEFGGSGEAGGVLEAATDAIGINGGTGQDQIRTDGQVNVTAASELNSNGGGTTIFGGSDASAQSRAVTRATGLDGGDDDDVIENFTSGAIDVSASTNVRADSVSYSFGGGSGADNALSGESFANGMVGGDGSDQLANNGFLKASSDVVITAIAGTDTTFTGGGNVDATGKSDSLSRAVGMSGGDGDDVVVSRGTIVVEATTVAESQNRASSAASFTSEGFAGSTSKAIADAIGLDGGAGVNTLVNEGSVIVGADSTAYAFSYSNGATVSLSGDASARATSTARSTATGILAGDGDTVVINDTGEDERIDVTATAGTAKDLTTTLTTYRLQGNNDESVEPAPEDQLAQTFGVLPDVVDMDGNPSFADGDIVYCTDSSCVANENVNSAGNHYVYSVVQTDPGDPGDPGDDTVDPAIPPTPPTPPTYDYSWVVVDAVGGEPDWDDPAVQAAYSDGQIVACLDESCRDDPEVAASATYYRVSVSPDPDDPTVDLYSWNILNGLTIEVNVDVTETSFPTYAFANGNGLDGTGRAIGTGISTATAIGIELGDGNNSVMSGNMNVRAIANTVVNVGSDGDVFGSSIGRVTTNSATARAAGIELGNGNNNVLNTGSLMVSATPSAQAFSEVSPGGGVCIWFFGWWCGGEGTPDAEISTIFVAEASGITAGNGNNSITNDGSINVMASPDVALDSRRNAEYVNRIRGDGSPRNNEVTADSAAIGIRTGDGNDVVTNNGSIDVSAYDLQGGCIGAAICNLSASAVGIQTGDGDDVVTNNGSISAVTFVNGIGSSHIGIDLGLGNDSLTLGGLSSVFGSIDLGEGDDWLTLIGMPTATESGGGIFALQAGTGMDSLLFMGDGYFAGSLVSFESATKSGEGVFSLTQPLATLDTLTIDGGILSLGSDYTFADTGSFSTYIHSDGDEGRLEVIGAVNADGAISIERRGETYIANDTTFTVVSATAGVTNGFTDITLPEARPLLSFELQQNANSVDVVALAPSFSTVTSNSSYGVVGENVFGLTGVASGDFSEQLGTLQLMESGFDRALASLSPDSYESLTSNTLALGHQATQLLRTHLGNARAVRRGSRSASTAYEPVVLAYNAGELQTNGAAIQPFFMGQLGPIHDDDPDLAGADSSGSRRVQTQTWASAFLASGDYDVVDGLTEYDHDSAGFTIGADHLYGEDVIAGVMINYSETDIDQLQAAAVADIYAWSAGVYATKFWDDSYLEGGITYTNQTFKNWRLLEIGPEERLASSEHDGETWMAFVGVGREYNFGTWHMEPYGTLYYFDIAEDAFAETGAESLNLIFEKKSTDALLGEIGTTFVRLQDVNSGVIDWHASLAYNHDFDINDGSIAYAYDGQPGSVLRIDDRNITSGSAVVGAGFTYIRERSALALDYRGQFNDNYRNNIVGLRLAYSF
jgi:uncharacterized protein YhjY with autotransporter beta-barrel domain